MTSTTQHHPVTVSCPEGLPYVDLEREFDATPEQVFRAHVEPELVARWLGPHDLTNEIDQWDARDGGSWRYVSRRGDDEFWFHGCFHQIVPGRRIVQTFTYEGFPDGVSLEVLELDELPGGRCLLRAHSVAESVDSRDAMVAAGMESGIVAGYEKLDALLAG
jgi:uncharacterized protein YndB with AHSA1/START domain